MPDPTPVHIGRRVWLALFLLVLAVVMLWRYRGLSETELLQLDGATMGTTWQVQVASADLQNIDDGPAVLHAAIGERLDTLDHEHFSTWSEQSELSRFNAAEPPVARPVSREMATVTAMAREVHELSGGAFDPTVGPLVRLWGFGPDFSRTDIPDEDAIEAARAQVGFSAVKLEVRGDEGPVLRRDVPRELDYSAIAKGFAVDEIARLLESRGIQRYLVEIGGELLVRGHRPDGREWRVGIETPQGGPRTVYRTIGNDGERLAIAASGDYRNFFELDGRRYSHGIDPETGWPVSHRLVSVTVLHESAAMADAFATALMIMGEARSRELATGLGLPVHLIMGTDSAFDTWHSPAFEAYLRDVGPASGSRSSTAAQDPE